MTDTEEKLKTWEGQYGSLKIFTDKSKLQMDDGQPSGKRDLIVIDENTFLDGKIILKFNLNEIGSISLQCHFQNGSKLLFPCVQNTPVSEVKKDKLQSYASIIATVGILPTSLPVSANKKSLQNLNKVNLAKIQVLMQQTKK